MKNPILAVYKEKHIDRLDLAIIAGVDESYIRHIEVGRVQKLSPKVRKALAMLGYDDAEMARKFDEWRKELVQQVLEKVMS